tara:strand:- start:253 stop:1617 length:1365 start_codon:yes stop_codon:yes gene_type:complete
VKEDKKRDYKAEYKKFQSSTKAKKYRAELNKYNRKKGTYGNGDGKDASHKGGKIVGFESQSKNRGRAEKSRLKKETVIKVSKKDDIAGNPMKMSGEEKIKKLVYSGSNGKGSYEIKGNKLNVIGIRPRDKGFFVRHFTMKTGFRKANLYYDGVQWQGKNKFESVNEAGTKSIDGEELMNFLMKRFKYSKKKAIDVMKKHKMDTSFLKNESVNEGFTSSQLGKLRNQMKGISRVDPSGPTYKKLTKLLDVLSISELQQIAKANIKFMSLLAKSRLVRKGIKDSVEEGFGGELTGEDKKKFEKARKENAEQLGYKVTGKSDIKESITVRNGEAPIEGKWGVYDNSTGKAIKEVGNARAATRLMNRLMVSGKYNEVAAKWIGDGKNKSVNEAKSKTMKTIGSIIGKKQAQKISGVLVDMQTALVIMKVWNALGASNRSKFEKLPIKQMANVAWKLVK